MEHKSRYIIAIFGLLAGAVVVILLYNLIIANNNPTEAAAATGPSTASLDPEISESERTTDLSEPEVTASEDNSHGETTVVAETSAKVARSTDAPQILTEDDRSGRLKSLTSSWNTDWNRHTILYDDILSGGPPRDGIPSIDNPQFVGQEEASKWLAGIEPVVSLEIDGVARAYPIQVLTWHEIVNDELAGVPVAVTFCPLCNSAITFDRRFGDQVFEFGTSGLLRNSDLIMYDRTTESLWQQFTGEGIVGELAGEMLTFVPSSMISFDDFRAAYPDGEILSRETGYSRNYGTNPYVGYDDINQSPFLYNGPSDGRLRPMERVVTLSLDEVDVAYPLSILAEVGVIADAPGGQDLVVFHVPGTASALDAPSIAASADVGATGVFDPNLGDQLLSFKRDGKSFVDNQTGSIWNVVGQAIEGPLAGEQLNPIVHADHFWFSWAAFRPDTVVYAAE